MPDSETEDLGKVLSKGIYRIPNYQRGYAWTSEEVNAFLDDLEYVTDNESVGSHYINSIIVTDRKDETHVYDIIDGQQRVITSSLVAHEILRKAHELANRGDHHDKGLKENIQEKLYDFVFKYSGKTQYRVLPAKEHREVYKSLVAEDFDAERNLGDALDLSNSPSGEKLTEAVETIERRLAEFLESQDGDEQASGSGVRDKLTYLNNLASTLHGGFSATRHEVDSSSEAGRIFEAINDRGRDLNRADKIKSYLVYRTTLDGTNVDVEDIHETFTRIYEILNEYVSDPGEVDNLVDRLIAQHWLMFAGESQISSSSDLAGRHEEATEDIEQMKYAKYHVPKEAEENRVEKWVEAYLSSLEEAAHAYVQLRGVEQDGLFDELESDLSADVDRNEVRHYLYAIERFGRSTMHSLMISLYVRFVDKDSFEDVAESLEKLVFRTFGIGGARRDTNRSDLEDLSRVLFWKGRDDLMEVYPAGSSIPEAVQDDADEYGIDGSPSDADSVVELVEKWAHDYSHESVDGSEIDDFERRLREENLDGLGVAGWGGINTSEIKNYMLYRYEVEIREGGAGVPPYLDTGIYDYTVEHVWPDDRSDEEIAPDLDDDEYAQHVERLGNLAFLSLSENSSAGNLPYEKKWERTYDEARDGTKMFRTEFPDPTGETSNKATEEGFTGWGTDVIEWRSERMAEELADYWGCSV